MIIAWKVFLMSILTSVWNSVNIFCGQSKSNNALENQTKCCVVQPESFGVELCDGSYKAITYLLPLTTIYILWYALCTCNYPQKKVNLTTSTPWLLQSWAIYLILYVFNKSKLIEHTCMLKLINCWTWICINVYMLNWKLITKCI
jgi:hypothetical protein